IADSLDSHLHVSHERLILDRQGGYGHYAKIFVSSGGSGICETSKENAYSIWDRKRTEFRINRKKLAHLLKAVRESEIELYRGMRFVNVGASTFIRAELSVATSISVDIVKALYTSDVSGERFPPSLKRLADYVEEISDCRPADSTLS
ncbi:MAG: hypothetical protein HY368_03255, partial [Candidatus Aenigmarchaeota archaeon]|nr:hypothetical protein [Candidatus Aenigmarchaeota archaeon]